MAEFTQAVDHRTASKAFTATTLEHWRRARDSNPESTSCDGPTRFRGGLLIRPDALPRHATELERSSCTRDGSPTPERLETSRSRRSSQVSSRYTPSTRSRGSHRYSDRTVGRTPAARRSRCRLHGAASSHPRSISMLRRCRLVQYRYRRSSRTMHSMQTWGRRSLGQKYLRSHTEQMIQMRFMVTGGSGGSRTRDLLLARQTLFQLSYAPITKETSVPLPTSTSHQDQMARACRSCRYSILHLRT